MSLADTTRSYDGEADAIGGGFLHYVSDADDKL